jgi:hypothetical protein
MRAGSVSIDLPEATKAMICASSFSKGHPSRHRDCQRSVVSELNDLVDRATSAGWSRHEVIVALADLLDAETSDASGLLQMMVANLHQSGPKRDMMPNAGHGLKSDVAKSCG